MTTIGQFILLILASLFLLVSVEKKVLASQPSTEPSLRLFIVGDSTASNYPPSAAPRAGWGQVLQGFLNDRVAVVNAAASGRSSKSFIAEQRLEKVLNSLAPGDYLFIQFGHNDAKPDVERHTDPFTTYQEYLSIYINGAREKGAIPILLTPVNRRNFDANGKLKLTHGDYPAAMIQLGEKLNVPVIDLGAKSQVLFEEWGEEGTKQLFLWLKPGEHPNYPEGVEDNTHFCETGAREVAKLVVEGIRELALPLAAYLK
ncbi:MAG: rhamnogalacturonan acetylesterase [Firmicutes bacterium]|nr:rhamnogalacturonan acetylesterase [Bacillota bacterium]